MISCLLPFKAWRELIGGGSYYVHRILAMITHPNMEGGAQVGGGYTSREEGGTQVERGGGGTQVEGGYTSREGGTQVEGVHK